MNNSKFAKTCVVNPLDVLNMRKSLVCLPTFSTFNLADTNNSSVENWVQKNCTGRYYCATGLTVNKDTNKINKILKVGFEKEEEASYFILGCPYVR